jgi:hypothetical protein
MKEKIDKMDLIKTKTFCFTKYNVKRIRRQAQEQKEIFVKEIRDKRLLYKMYKNSSNSTRRKQQPDLKIGIDVNRHLTRNDRQRTNKQIKRQFISHVMRKMQIQTVM